MVSRSKALLLGKVAERKLWNEIWGQSVPPRLGWGRGLSGGPCQAKATQADLNCPHCRQCGDLISCTHIPPPRSSFTYTTHPPRSGATHISWPWGGWILLQNCPELWLCLPPQPPCYHSCPGVIVSPCPGLLAPLRCQGPRTQRASQGRWGHCLPVLRFPKEQWLPSAQRPLLAPSHSQSRCPTCSAQGLSLPALCWSSGSWERSPRAAGPAAAHPLSCSQPANQSWHWGGAGQALTEQKQGVHSRHARGAASLRRRGQARQSCMRAPTALSVLQRCPHVSDENMSACGDCHEDHRDTHQAAVGPEDDGWLRAAISLVPSASEASLAGALWVGLQRLPGLPLFIKPSANRQPLNCSQGERRRRLIHQAGTQNWFGKKTSCIHFCLHHHKKESAVFVSWCDVNATKKALGIIQNTRASLVMNVGVDTVTPGEQGALAAVFFSGWFSRGRANIGEGACTYKGLPWPSM